LVERIAGPPTILIHCAGNHLKRDVVGTTDEEFAAVLMTHVQASFALSRLVIPHMRRAGGGSILFIASMTSFIGMPLVAAYSAAKSAMLGLVRSMAVELGPDNIRVNAIAPGWVETDMLRTAFAGDPIREGRALARTPLGRFGDPDEIGEAALYLSSGRASFVTGVCLPVDGGGLIGY
jgi:gluconate 5-dehydrogenase